MINFKKLDNVAAFDTALETIRVSRKAIEDATNTWAPQAISGVYAGDNIAQVNSLIGAFGGVQKTRITGIIKKLLPYQFDKDTEKFTKKETKAAVVARKTEAYSDFIESGETFWTLVDQTKKADAKTVDYAKKITKDVEGALSHGLTVDIVLALVNAAIAHAAAAELLKEPLANAA